MTAVEHQDRRLPEPTLVEWLRNQQRVFDEGGASKDRRPELTAVLIESQRRQIDEAHFLIQELLADSANFAIRERSRAFLTDGAPSTEEDQDAVSRCEFCGNQYGDDRCGCDAAKDAEITKLTSQLDEARARNDRLSSIIEAERSQVAERMSVARKVVERRQWMREGRGPYEWNDDDYRREFSAAADDFLAALAPLRKIAADLSDCPANQRDVKAARNLTAVEEARAKAIEEAATKIEERAAEWDKIEPHGPQFAGELRYNAKKLRALIHGSTKC